MCRALGSSRTREKEPCDRVLSLPCGFHKQSREAALITSIVQRFLTAMHLRLPVILLGRVLPLLRSTATLGAFLLQALGKTPGRKTAPARIVHTRACINDNENAVQCFAQSADVCGLLAFHPPITDLAHFHSRPKEPNPKATLAFRQARSFSSKHPLCPHTSRVSVAQAKSTSHEQALIGH